MFATITTTTPWRKCQPYLFSADWRDDTESFRLERKTTSKVGCDFQIETSAPVFYPCVFSTTDDTH